MTRQAPVAVSLIVSTIGQTDRLPRLAASLARQSRRDFELILVDQAPAGRLDPFLRDLPPWLCVTRILSARGLSRGRNAGLALARGAIIGMPDDDAWLPDGLIADLVARFAARPELSFISGVTRDAQGKLSNGRFLAVETPVDRRTVWQAGNSNGIFFRSAAARAAGGFDPLLGAGAGTPFGAGEETDFLLRVLAQGGRGMFMPDLVVHHDQVDLSGLNLPEAEFLHRAGLYAQGYGRVLRLNGYPPGVVAWRILRNLGAAGLAGLRGDWPEWRRRWRWVRGIPAGYRGRA